MTLYEILEKIYHVIETPIVTINQTPISLSSITMFFLIIIVFSLISKTLKTRFLNKILTKFHLEEGLKFTFVRITQYIIIGIGIMVALQFVGIDLSGIAVVLGFLSVGIGFGLQNVTSNFISGIILLFERPIRVGDRVTVGEYEGDVQNINIRATTIITLNNISIIVPNSDFISNPVTNWSHGDKKIRVDLTVGVSYSSDLDLVLKVLKEIAEKNITVLKSPAPEVHLKELGDSSWNMNLRVWIPDPKEHYYVSSELNCEIVRQFRVHNIEIPFPQRDLHLRSAVPIKTGVENISKKS